MTTLFWLLSGALGLMGNLLTFLVLRRQDKFIVSLSNQLPVPSAVHIAYKDHVYMVFHAVSLIFASRELDLRLDLISEVQGGTSGW